MAMQILMSVPHHHANTTQRVTMSWTSTRVPVSLVTREVTVKRVSIPLFLISFYLRIKVIRVSMF